LKLKTCSLAGILIAALSVTPAAAQTTTSPVVDLAYGGLATGSASVKNTGPFLGAEAGARVWKNLDVFLEGGSFDDVVPQKQIDVAAPLVTRLTQTQGTAASATVKMPANYFGVGARWVFEDRVIAGWVRPYAQFSVGGARVKREPTFLLGGADITSSLLQYGVVIGQDLTKQEKASAVSFGVGALVPWRYLYVDVGYRRTNIQLDDPIGVNRFHFGLGARF
jgi:hypothetical protein